MSTILYSSSFRLLPVKKHEIKDITKHEFFYDVHDIAVLQEKSDNVRAQFGLLAEMGGVYGLATAFRSDVKNGLYEDEIKAGFDIRIKKYGQNVYPKPPMATFLEHCWETLHDPMLIILIIAGVVSIVLGSVEHGADGWFEGIAIIFAVFLVTVVGAANEVQQEKQFRALDESKEAEKCSVVRAGKSLIVPAEEVLVGDVVYLDANNHSFIPADGVMITDEPILVDESKMTGESRDVKKEYKDPFLRGGTNVKEGDCLMLCVAVGVNSAYGRIMESLAEEAEPTPLQKKLEKMAALIGYIGAATAIILFLVLLARWIAENIKQHRSWGDEVPELLEFFIISVTIVVVAVPEGLPLAVTISLAYSMKQMFKDKNLVRFLDACETMGNATTICSDKTGTLTQNLMTVVECWITGRYYERKDSAGKGIPSRDEITKVQRRLILEGVVVNSKSKLAEGAMIGPIPEQWKWLDGNQTDQSLMAWLYGYNTCKKLDADGKKCEWALDWLDINAEREKYQVEKNYPFDSKNKRSSVVLKNPGGGYRQYFKGAAEKLLDLCDRAVVDADGKIEDLKANKEKIEKTINQMARGGLRTIAFCYVDYDELPKDPETDKLLDPPEPTNGIFWGLMGIHDPLRPSSRLAVQRSQAAGVIVRMVTGDHLETAKSIAMDCDILTSKDHIAMTGEEFRALKQSGRESELEEKIPKLRVLARSRPQDKEHLVEWLKAHGEVVGVTGDGTNDAPALKKANVGIAMGIAGTRVAKSAARIVILDDEFSSVVTAIKWGRCVYDNIKKFVQFQLTINLVALTITLLGALANFKNPLKAIQLLWINLIMDTMAALALGTEKPTEQLLNRKPYTKDAQLISKIMIRNIAGQASFQMMILLLFLFAGPQIFPDRTWKEKSVHHFTLVFNVFVWMQLFNEINSRKVNDEQNVFQGFFTNWIYHTILIITIGFQILMVQVFGPFAETDPITGSEWGICIGFGALSLVVGALLRLIPVDPDWGRVGPSKDAFAKDLPEWVERQNLRNAAASKDDAKETTGLIDRSVPSS